jgi:hypothetical protein
LRVSASLLTPKSNTRDFSDRNAQTLLMLHLVSFLFTVERNYVKRNARSGAWEVKGARLG